MLPESAVEERMGVHVGSCGDGRVRLGRVKEQQRMAAGQQGGEHAFDNHIPADGNLCDAVAHALEIFKKDLGTFTRFYEFMSQIVDYDDKNLEKWPPSEKVVHVE